MTRVWAHGAPNRAPLPRRVERQVGDVPALAVARSLTLQATASSGRPRAVSGASGLVVTPSAFFVIPDDSHHLAVFPRRGARPGRLVRLFAGDLPRNFDQRKAQKPDLEALTLLAPEGREGGGTILGIGSGSTPSRARGFMLELDPDGKPKGKPKGVDLGPLYRCLGKRVVDLNVEGAAATKDQLVLLHRGNGARARSAVIRLDLAKVRTALQRRGALGADAVISVRAVNLGSLNGVRLGFSDASALPDGRIAFSAVAERTDNPYDDGECAGSAVGILEADDSTKVIGRIEGHKVEGIHARVTGSRLELLMVTDADDPNRPSPLLRATFALSGRSALGV